ncbi:Coiled-coil domain-containing protein 65-like protein [Diplonema papillatum]|nr:Coiled-coil domain-containing protein 65-like protein [Diplonema papillatum]
MPLYGKLMKGGAKVTRDKDTAEMDRFRDVEERKKRETLLKTRMQELMEEEAQYSKESQREVQMRWVELLRREKYVELSADVEVLRQVYDKTLDRKNAVIEMLMGDLTEAEEQYRLALRTHLQHIDSLIELHNQRSSDLDAQYESDLKELKQEFELEKSEIVLKHHKEVDALHGIMNAIKKDADEQDSEIQTDFSQKKDETRDKNQEEYNVLKQMLEGEILEYQHQINHEHDKYMQSAEEKMKTYLDLTNKDAETADKISRQMRRILKLQEMIANWKANLANNIKECEERNRAMKEEKEMTAKHFKELKHQMQRWRSQQEEKLSRLVVQAREARSALETNNERAERILRLSELCRALETERERVLRFRNDLSVQEVETEAKINAEKQAQFEARRDGMPQPQMNPVLEAASKDMTELLRQDTLTESWQFLENFWKKFNKVLLDNAAISREKYHLMNENSKLRALLKQYLDGISVNDDVMGGRNNLLACHTFKGTTPTPLPEANRGIPVIEAKQVIASIAKQKQRAY